jgi:hypothetical protein
MCFGCDGDREGVWYLVCVDVDDGCGCVWCGGSALWCHSGGPSPCPQ